MKKLTALLILVCLLCGCGGEGQNTTIPPAAETVPVLTEEGISAPDAAETVGEGLVRNPEEETGTAPTEEVSIAPGQASYSILENDNSIRNDNGDILVKIRYDQLILDTARPEWKPINDRIAEHYRTFLAESAYLSETPPEEWEAMLRDMGALYGNLFAVCTPEVTCNGGGIFSIRMTRDWFMGGVYNRDSWGLNFDLTTGQELPLARLSELPEAEFAQQLKTIVCQALEPNRDALFEDPAVTLEAYTLADFSFCIEKGELVLLFPTYTFGPGVLGATEVKTGLYPTLG